MTRREMMRLLDLGVAQLIVAAAEVFAIRFPSTGAVIRIFPGKVL